MDDFFAPHFPEFHLRRHVPRVAHGIHSHTLLWGVMGCSKALSKATMATQPICNTDFPPQIFPVWVFSLISKEAFSKKTLHGPHHRGHTRSGQGTRGTTRSTSPVLQLKGQLQIFPKCPTPPLALLHLPHTEPKSLSPGSVFLALGMLVLLMVPVL